MKEQADPKKYYAKAITARAIKTGHLVRQPCETCKDLNVHAHHDDYSQPLKVRWLCPRHHSWHHVQANIDESEGVMVEKLVRITQAQADLLAKESQRRQITTRSYRRHQTGRGMEAAIIREALQEYLTDIMRKPLV